MGSLDRFDVQKALSFILVDRGILRVGKGTRLPVAETRHIVFVPAEVLVLVRQFGLERAELLVDHLPDDLIALHLAHNSCLSHSPVVTCARSGQTFFSFLFGLTRPSNNLRSLGKTFCHQILVILLYKSA